MMKYTPEALKDLADRIQRGEHPPIPLLDKNRKEVGQVTDVYYEDGVLRYKGEFYK